MANSVIWFEVMGSDHAASKKFYGEMFDWGIEDLPDSPSPYAGVTVAGDERASGGIGVNPPGAPSGVTFYVHVDDLEAALAKAESLGGKRYNEPMDIPGGQIAHFGDPDGNMVGLINVEM